MNQLAPNAARVETGGRRPLWRAKSRALLALFLVAWTHLDASGQLVVSDTSVGYIDTAVPFTHVRMRFDAGFGADFPDRAEFFYGTWAGAAPGAPGPPLRETNLDYQDLQAYFEYAPWDDFSIFADAPVRFLNPEVNDNTAGYGDMTAGVKWAVAQDACSVTTLQLKTYLPTGDADRGLGTDHLSLEPGLLALRRLSERLTFEGEIRDWISIGGTEGFEGHVLRYGAGLSYLALQSCCWHARPVVEGVGWTVLEGRKTGQGGATGVFDADGDTIFNLKAGVRFGFGGSDLYDANKFLYIGYGRALTGDVWYTDIIRAELRMLF
jgi:hypothetical protein